MRTTLSQFILGLLLLALASGAAGQTPSTDFAHGVHYTFERMTATRTVRDAFDRGPITLVAHVYRPVGADRRKVVLFSHGSTGGWEVSPKQPFGAPRSLVQYFTKRGYTVVAAMRRGRNESSGRYVEECEFQAGKCSLAENTALFDSSLREATLDSLAIVDQVIYGRLVPKNSTILLAGGSRGGFLSLVLAAERPRMAAGVFNFVGGWLSISDAWPAELNQRRLQLQTDRLTRVGTQLPVPTLWIYGDRDPFYSEAVTRQFFAAFERAGGKGEYFFVSDPTLKDGHGVGSALALWETKADEYLAQIER